MVGLMNGRKTKGDDETMVVDATLVVVVAVFGANGIAVVSRAVLSDMDSGVWRGSCTQRGRLKMVGTVQGGNKL